MRVTSYQQAVELARPYLDEHYPDGVDEWGLPYVGYSINGGWETPTHFIIRIESVPPVQHYVGSSPHWPSVEKSSGKVVVESEDMPTWHHDHLALPVTGYSR